MRGQCPQASASEDEIVGGLVAQLMAKFLAGRDQEGFEMVDRLGARADRAATGAQQDANVFAVTAGARLGEVIALEDLAGGTDGVELVGFGAVAARRALG